MMINKILLLGGLCFIYTQANIVEDQDFDGVPDSMDKCQDTPFLHEVDKQDVLRVFLPCHLRQLVRV
ncbi:MAG: hypothetical protein Q9M36_04310 [Sulfurovum sp.]|nr:hypothetical protein [Sulfurovum sp.]